jgi:hypothetical protein
MAAPVLPPAGSALRVRRYKGRPDWVVVHSSKASGNPPESQGRRSALVAGGDADAEEQSLGRYATAACTQSS